MRNGSFFVRPATEILKSYQHGQHPFQLTVKMHLVSTKPLQLTWIESFAKSMFADQRLVGEFFFPSNIPGQNLAFEMSLQAFGIGCGGLLILVKIVRIDREHILPGFPRIVL